jgi:hypothetical protein
VKINVAKASSTALEAALVAVNGRASANTTTTANEVRSIAEEAENALAGLGLPKCHRRGASAVHVSGKGLARAYQYRGIATEVRLHRGARDWYLVGVERVPAYPGDAGRALKVRVSLDQDAQAAEARRRAFGITVAAATC